MGCVQSSEPTPVARTYQARSSSRAPDTPTNTTTTSFKVHQGEPAGLRRVVRCPTSAMVEHVPFVECGRECMVADCGVNRVSVAKALRASPAHVITVHVRLVMRAIKIASVLCH